MFDRRNLLLWTSASIPLITSSALAQNRSSVDVFADAIGRLDDQKMVRQKYFDLGLYVELVRRLPPHDAVPTDLEATTATYALLGGLIKQTDGKVDPNGAKIVIDLLRVEYLKNEKLFINYLQGIGIVTDSAVGNLIQSSIIWMMLFSASANKAKELKDTHFCIFPFCFGKPG